MLSAALFYVSFTAMAMSVILFFYNGGYKKANAYLAIFLFLSSFFYFINYVYLFSHSVNLIAVFLGGFPALIYLTGPMAYLYVRSILRDDTRLSPADYLHFLLFGVVLVGVIPFLVSDFGYKLKIATMMESQGWSSLGTSMNSFLPVEVNRFLRAVHPFLYALCIMVELYRHRNRINLKLPGPAGFRVVRNWLLLFSGFFMLSAFVHLVIFIRVLSNGDKVGFLTSNLIWVVLLSSAYIFLMVGLLLFPRILYGLPMFVPMAPAQPFTAGENGEGNVPDESVSAERKNDAEQSRERYVQSYSDEYLQQLSRTISEWVNQQHFLKEDCSIITLALQTGIPQHHLSYYLNSVLGLTFPDWRNNLRIDHAKMLLDQGLHKKITMEAVAAQCGFSSQTTFNRAFRNALGVTPSQYLKLKS